MNVSKDALKRAGLMALVYFFGTLIGRDSMSAFMRVLSNLQG